MRQALLAAIDFYQRFISPHKGFTCAYREHTGRASCSVLGYRAVRRYGALPGLVLIRKRTALCGVVHRRFGPHIRKLHRESGVCDVGCDLPGDAGCHMPSACDPPGGRNLLGVCDYASCCDCGGCDWPRRDKKVKSEERFVHIPPNKGRRPSRPGPDHARPSVPTVPATDTARE